MASDFSIRALLGQLPDQEGQPMAASPDAETRMTREALIDLVERTIQDQAATLSPQEREYLTTQLAQYIQMLREQPGEHEDLEQWLREYTQFMGPHPTMIGLAEGLGLGDEQRLRQRLQGLGYDDEQGLAQAMIGMDLAGQAKQRVIDQQREAGQWAPESTLDLEHGLIQGDDLWMARSYARRAHPDLLEQYEVEDPFDQEIAQATDVPWLEQATGMGVGVSPMALLQSRAMPGVEPIARQYLEARGYPVSPWSQMDMTRDRAERESQFLQDLVGRAGDAIQPMEAQRMLQEGQRQIQEQMQQVHADQEQVAREDISMTGPQTRDYSLPIYRMLPWAERRVGEALGHYARDPETGDLIPADPEDRTTAQRLGTALERTAGDVALDPVALANLARLGYDRRTGGPGAWQRRGGLRGFMRAPILANVAIDAGSRIADAMGSPEMRLAAEYGGPGAQVGTGALHAARGLGESADAQAERIAEVFRGERHPSELGTEALGLLMGSDVAHLPFLGPELGHRYFGTEGAFDESLQDMDQRGWGLSDINEHPFGTGEDWYHALQLGLRPDRMAGATLDAIHQRRQSEQRAEQRQEQRRQVIENIRPVREQQAEQRTQQLQQQTRQAPTMRQSLEEARRPDYRSAGIHSVRTIGSTQGQETGHDW